MNRLIAPLALGLLAVSLSACKQDASPAASAMPTAATEPAPASTPDAMPLSSGSDLAAKAGDIDMKAFPGVFSGTLPCASCPGIDTRLELQADGPYKLTEVYQDEAGPPVFNSVYFACNALSATTTQSDVTITNAEQAAVVAAGSNNTTNGTAAAAYTSTYLPGTGATGTTPFNAATLNPSGSAFLVQTSYIGAINGAGDTWYQGWTCNSNRANFGASSGACATVPAI